MNHHDPAARTALEVFRARHEAWLREAFWSGFAAGVAASLLVGLTLWSLR